MLNTESSPTAEESKQSLIAEKQAKKSEEKLPEWNAFSDALSYPLVSLQTPAGEKKIQRKSTFKRVPSSKPRSNSQPISLNISIDSPGPDRMKKSGLNLPKGTPPE